MKVFIKFDCYADIVEVPEAITQSLSKYKRKFLNWMYDRKNDHGYWVKVSDGKGSWYYGVEYGSDAFVKWLNKRVIKDKYEKAVIVERDLDIDDYDGIMPSIFF